MNNITYKEKERQAILSVLGKCEILDEIDIVCGEIQNKLSEIRKEEDVFEFGSLISEVVTELENTALYANSHNSSREELRNSLDLIRKKYGLVYDEKINNPIDNVNIDLLINNSESRLDRLNDYFGQLLKQQKVNGKKFISDEEINQLCNSSVEFDKTNESKLDLAKLEKQLDDALNAETKESLTEWLLKQRNPISFDEALVIAGYTDPMFESVETNPNKDLVNQIVGLMQKSSDTAYSLGSCGECGDSYDALDSDMFVNVATEIASLVPFKSDKIGTLKFAEWISNNKWGKHPYDGLWCTWIYEHGECVANGGEDLTTNELFDLFKNEERNR